MNSVDSVEIIKKKIRSVFSAAISADTNNCNELSHEELAEYAGDLSYLEPEDIRIILPFILLDILDHPPKSYRDVPYVSHIFFDYLDVHPVPMLEQIKRINNPSHRDQMKEAVKGLENLDSDVAASREQMFQCITHEESRAVCDWLMFIRSWKDFHTTREVEIDSAIKYWELRAASGDAAAGGTGSSPASENGDDRRIEE